MPPVSPSDLETPFSDVPPPFVDGVLGVPGSIEPGFPIQADQFNEEAIMEDVAHGKGGENPCLHVVTTVEREEWLRHPNSANRTFRGGDSSGAAMYIIKNPLGFMGENTTPRGVLPPMYEPLPFPEDPYLPGKALVTMWPEVETEVSALNFIYELKDLRTLPKTLSSLRNLVSLLGRKGRAADLVKDVSDVYLQNEFGIQPLVRDVQSYAAAVRSVQDKFVKYFSEQNTVLRRHYRTRYRPDPAPWPAFTEFSTPYGSPTTHKGAHTSGVPEVTYTATMVYSYSLPDLGPDAEQALRAFSADLLGIQWNPRVLWDAIPYTFLLDYVVKVGDWLDQFKIRNLEPEVVIWDFIHSIRYVAERRHWVYPWQLSKNGGWCYCGCMRQHVYKRESRVSIDVYDTLITSGLSGRQIFNMIALVGGRSGRGNTTGD